MQTNAHKHYSKPSELRRPSTASRNVDSKTVIPNGRHSQRSKTIDMRCVNVTLNEMTATKDGFPYMAKRRRTAAGHHTQRLIIMRSHARPALTNFPRPRSAVMSVGLHTMLHLVEKGAIILPPVARRFHMAGHDKADGPAAERKAVSCRGVGTDE